MSTWTTGRRAQVRLGSACAFLLISCRRSNPPHGRGSGAASVGHDGGLKRRHPTDQVAPGQQVDGPRFS